MKKQLVIGIVGSLFVWGSHAWAEETCVDEKLQIQQLTQSNAQLQATAAQLQFNAAQIEKTRLEALKKAVPTNGATTTAPVAPPEEKK